MNMASSYHLTHCLSLAQAYIDLLALSNHTQTYTHIHAHTHSSLVPSTGVIALYLTYLSNFP